MREIASTPEKILDAPELKDDYYINILDWSPKGLLAVSLNTAIYLWNSHSGGIHQLLSTNDNLNYISSVSWMHDILAVGFANNSLEIWDANQMRCIRTITSHTGRVCSLAWNGIENYLLSSGSKDTTVC
jgi:cell division cycle protein 20 (cofactor of APC complex)